MIEPAMVARLLAASALTDLIGARLYPVEAPPGAEPPYVLWRRGDTAADDTFDDKSVHHAAFAFEAHAKTYAEALAICAALRTILDGWRGEAPEAIMSMTYAGEHDGAGVFDEDQRRRRSFCRELVFMAMIRA